MHTDGKRKDSHFRFCHKFVCRTETKVGSGCKIQTYQTWRDFNINEDD